MVFIEKAVQLNYGLLLYIKFYSLISVMNQDLGFLPLYP